MSCPLAWARVLASVQVGQRGLCSQKTDLLADLGAVVVCDCENGLRISDHVSGVRAKSRCPWLGLVGLAVVVGCVRRLCVSEELARSTSNALGLVLGLRGRGEAVMLRERWLSRWSSFGSVLAGACCRACGLDGRS